MYDKGQATVKDVGKKYRELMHKACEGGVGMACQQLALAYEDEVFGKNNTSKAIVYYKKGCEANQALSCSSLGLHYRFGENGIQKDIQKAIKYYKKACDLELMSACKDYYELTK